MSLRRIERERPDKLANWRDRLEIALVFLQLSLATARPPCYALHFHPALRGLTSKEVGRGAGGQKTYRTLMAAGMHFMDRYNYDTERIRRCVIQYSTVDGIYPFCTINAGPTYRPYLERMYSATLTPDRIATQHSG